MFFFLLPLPFESLFLCASFFFFFLVCLNIVHSYKKCFQHLASFIPSGIRCRSHPITGSISIMCFTFFPDNRNISRYYAKGRSIGYKPVVTRWVLQWPLNWCEKCNSLGTEDTQMVKYTDNFPTEINRVSGRQHSWKWRKSGHSVYLVLKQMVRGLVTCVGTQNVSGWKLFGRWLNNKPTLYKKKMRIFQIYSAQL